MIYEWDRKEVSSCQRHQRRCSSPAGLFYDRSFCSSSPHLIASLLHSVIFTPHCLPVRMTWLLIASAQFLSFFSPSLTLTKPFGVFEAGVKSCKIKHVALHVAVTPCEWGSALLSFHGSFFNEYILLYSIHSCSYLDLLTLNTFIVHLSSLSFSLFFPHLSCLPSVSFSPPPSLPLCCHSRFSSTFSRSLSVVTFQSGSPQRP